MAAMSSSLSALAPELFAVGMNLPVIFYRHDSMTEYASGKRDARANIGQIADLVPCVCCAAQIDFSCLAQLPASAR